MPVRSVTLTDRFDHFIDDGVSSGRFTDASEVVQEALRLLELREAADKAKLEWLRGAASEGFAAIDRGEGIAFHSMDDLAAFIDETGEQIEAERMRG